MSKLALKVETNSMTVSLIRFTMYQRTIGMMMIRVGMGIVIEIPLSTGLILIPPLDVLGHVHPPKEDLGLTQSPGRRKDSGLELSRVLLGDPGRLNTDTSANTRDAHIPSPALPSGAGIQMS
jgi:hypothetical protein